MSIKQEEEKSAELECELEAVRAELKRKELRSKDLESELSEAVKTSELLVKKGDEKISALEEGRVELSQTIEKKEQELAENKKVLDALQVELQGHQNKLKQEEEKTLETLQYSQHLLREKDEEIALLKEEGTRMSCMSVKKEEAEVVELKKEVELMREDLQRKETSLRQADTQLLEALEIPKQKDEQITVLKEEIEILISMNAKIDIELAECKEELQMLQVEKESHDLILQEAESRVVQAESASEKLKVELEAVRLEIEDLKSVEEKASELESASVMKDDQIKELEGELARLSTRSAEHEKELAECKGELQALLSQVEEKDTRLKEAEKSVNQAVAASEKLTGEKEALELEVENLILAANDTSVRLSEAEKVRSALQDKITDIEMRMAQLEDREQSLIMEIDMLSSVNNGVNDVHDLEQEVLKLKEERDRLTLEVSSMDMQGAISDRLQFIQTLCIDTDDRITSMQSEIDELTSAKDALEAEVQAIEAHASRLLLELAEKEQIIELSRNHQNMDASSCVQEDASKEDLIAAQTKLHAAEESIVSMARTIEALNKTKAEKEEMYASLQERLEKTKENRNQAQDKLNALTVAMHEFSVLEESWRNEKENILSEIEDAKSQLTMKEAECLAVQEKNRMLEVRLQELEVEEAATAAELAALENDPKEVKALLNDDQVELAKTQAALAGAEERVKLLVDANATMRDDWEGERTRLNTEKELLQLEISRLENSASTPLMENRAVGVDAENSNDQFIDELKREIKRTRADCENLRIKIRERDDTILSVRLELEKAAVALKETNIEIEKYIREKEDALRRIAALDVELEDARKEIMRQEEQVFKLEIELEDSQKELMRREEEVYKFEVELDSVVMRVTASESQWKSKMDELERERQEAQLEAYMMAEKFETLKKEMEDAQAAAEEESPAHKQSMQELEDSVNLSLESIAAIASAKEEVDITKDHCEKEMETLAVDMQSLRADISNSFFEFPVVEIQQDVKSIIEGHRVEIATLTGKVKSLEGLLADSAEKVSTLEADLEEAQRARASLEAAEKKITLLDAENSRKELEMSEAAVTELLAAVSERDTSLSVLRERLEQTQSLLEQAEARLEASQLEVESAKVALNETEQLRSHVQSLQNKVAKKEEFIKGLEYDINLLEETGSAETEQKQEIINQLQKEVDAKKDELEGLKNQMVIQETHLREMKEELVASKAIAARAAEESIDMRSKLESRVALLEAKVEENDCTVSSLSKDLQATQRLLQESEADAAKAREVTYLLRMCALSLSFVSNPIFMFIINL
jgi:chromosome segregation ATPase